MKTFLTGFVSCVVLLVSAVASIAGPVSVTACGTLAVGTSSSFILTRDLQASGTCLTINTDNVTVDLQGHKIYSSNVGIFAQGKDVVIKNGRIVGCRTGVIIDNGGIIDNLTVSNGTGNNGIETYGSVPFVLRNSRIVNNAYNGVYYKGYSQILDNVISGNGADGISVPTVVGLVKGNTIAGNSGWGINNCQGYGGTKSGQVIDNRLDLNIFGGIGICQQDGLVEGNSVLSSNHGLYLGTAGIVYRNNTLSRNSINFEDNGFGNLDAGGNVMF